MHHGVPHPPERLAVHWVSRLRRQPTDDPAHLVFSPLAAVSIPTGAVAVQAA